MTYRRCGRSGLLLPAVSLGLWQNFGDDRPIDTQRAILREPSTWASPISTWPTTTGPLTAAPRPTSPGSSTRTSATTATSWSSPPRPAGTCGRAPTATSALASTSSPASTRACGASASTTSTSSTTIISTPNPLEETLGALHSAVTSGKALYVGISSYSDQRTAEAVAILRGLGTPLLIHQPSYSMLNRWIEDRLLDVSALKASGASPSPSWRRACSPTDTSTASPRLQSL
jgi:L-glyceraldehyde 3-phosphate reductase